MKKALLCITIVFCILPLAFAQASQTLTDMLLYDESDMLGAVLEALQTEDGMLLTGASQSMDSGWMAFFDRNGKQRWSYSKELTDLFRCPSPQPGNGFSVLLNRYQLSERDRYLFGPPMSSLMLMNANGRCMNEIPLPQPTEWLLADADGFLAIGYVKEGSGNKPCLTRLDGAGNVLWSYEYSNPDYKDMTFTKGEAAEDSIVIIGDAIDNKHQANAGLIYRVDMNGNVLWTREASLGDNSWINDICLTDDGLIAGIYTNLAYDEEDGFPSERLCSVFLMNMDGDVLWEYAVKKDYMLDYILPVAGGFLCASRGLTLENCPYIGDGWLLLLDREGQVRGENGTPFIGGGKYELFGMAKAADGEALLYGTLLNEPGLTLVPFAARLNFPEAYR